MITLSSGFWPRPAAAMLFAASGGSSETGRPSIAATFELLAEVSGFVAAGSGVVDFRRRKMRKRTAPRIASAKGTPTPTPTLRPRFELDPLLLLPLSTAAGLPIETVSLIEIKIGCGTDFGRQQLRSLLIPRYFLVRQFPDLRQLQRWGIS